MRGKFLLLVTAIICISVPVFGQSAAPVLDKGDTAWMLMSTALVMMMTPAGLALFYSGLTQSKAVLNTIGMSFVSYCT